MPVKTAVTSKWKRLRLCIANICVCGAGQLRRNGGVERGMSGRFIEVLSPAVFQVRMTDS